MDKIFTIDIDVLKKLNLNLVEYMLLRYLYHKKTESWEALVDIYGNVSLATMMSLEMKGYIKVTGKGAEVVSKKLVDIYELRDKTYDLFEGKKDLFLEFLSRFPIKTPSGRYLGTKNEDTVMGKKLRAKWNRVFGKDVIKQRKAIDVLMAEMEWRRKMNTLEYMHNMETWLNKGDFENYAYLLEDKSKEKKKIREDFE